VISGRRTPMMSKRESQNLNKQPKAGNPELLKKNNAGEGDALEAKAGSP